MILAIDSAPNRTGWALIDRRTPHEELIASGRLDTVNGQTVRAFVDGLLSKSTRRITGVAIEDVYLEKNPQTIKALAQLTGRWLQELERHNLTCRLVLASVWQRDILTGLISNDSPRSARKRAARQWVRAVFRAEVTEDEADAICMGVWESRRLAQEQLRAAARRR